MTSMKEKIKILNIFTTKFKDCLEDIFTDYELKFMSHEVKFNSLKILLEQMYLMYLKVNYKDPIKLADEYYKGQQTWKENQGMVLQGFIDQINDGEFKKKFQDEIGRLIEEDLSSNLNMTTAELKARIDRKNKDKK